MSIVTPNALVKYRREKDQESERRERRSPVDSFFPEAILAIRDKIRRIDMFQNLPVKDRFEKFRKNGS